MKKIPGLLLCTAFCLFISSCTETGKKETATSLANPEFLHRSIKRLNDVVIYEIFSPPVASRIYAYASLSAYEAIRWSDTTYPSLAAQFNGFPTMPSPEKDQSYDFTVAAVKAMFNITQRLTFTKDSSRITQDEILKELKETGIDKKTFERSLQFGDTIAATIWQRAVKDHYKETRGKERYTPKNVPGKWKNTPPDYLDAVEPFWREMVPLIMDSSSQFKPVAPPPYSLKKESTFFKEMTEVYETSKTLTAEQKEIARFWDDNPAAIEHSGHMMFVNKKASPGGHWINITAIACKSKNFSTVASAQAYAMVAATMFDGFISCWDEKYRSEYVRPVTAINESIDKNWQPMLQTPPFPEYTSGHSVVSSSIATTLTRIFGDNFSFTDDYELPYIGLKRSFPSFIKASEEACISRMYGGIHYKSAIENGKSQGRNLGNYITAKIKLK